MNSLELEVLKFTDSGNVHVKVNSDNDDLGMLYLTAKQFKEIKTLLISGCHGQSIDFSIKNIFDDQEYSDDEFYSLNNYSENNS
jgi:hypothetical protein